MEPGDVNADGLLDIVDIIIIINMVLGTVELDYLADLNGDAQVNIVDVILLVNIILS